MTDPTCIALACGFVLGAVIIGRFATVSIRRLEARCRAWKQLARQYRRETRAVSAAGAALIDRLSRCTIVEPRASSQVVYAARDARFEAWQVSRGGDA